ncbi:MAG TPA: hypothetical protein VGR35_21755 [Tepidisphaeraceae bacterium]|nr:hypothetical protein [Tepidisphaeraceae bacterium]
MANEYLYGVRTGRVASVALDGLTPLLLLAYVLGVIGGGIYMHTQLSSLVEQGRIDPSVSTGVMWTGLVVGIIMLFAVTGPMVLLGVFIASKIMKFPMNGAAYLKACGVAALPALMIMLANVLPQNLALRLLVVVAIIPVVFFVIKNTFQLSFGEGAVTFVASAITGLIGLVISGVIVATVMAGGIVSNKVASQVGGKQATGGFAALPRVTTPSLPTSSAPPSPPAPPATPVPPMKSPADSFRETLAARVTHSASASREQQQRELVSLKAQAEQTGATSHADVMNMLQDLEQRAAAAPSEQPEPALFEEPVAAVAWQPTDVQLALLDPKEVSFHNFNLRLPKDFRADLDVSESDAKVLSFSSGRGDLGKLVLRIVSAANQKQRRPWVTTQKFQAAAAEREKLFTVDGAGATTIEEGAIGGLPFTRIAHEAGKRWGVHGKSAQYVARTGDGWLVIDAIASSASPAGLEVLEGAARAIRSRPPGDPANDPLGAPQLAARLAEDPDRAAQLLRLKGKAAEDAVILQLKNAEPRAARAAAAVLGDIGTDNCLPALEQAARSSDTFLAGAAREALKKLKPEVMDAVAEALLDLESTDTHRKRAALDKLARMTPTPDDARREKVATLIEAEILGDNAFFVGENAAPALAAWAGKQTVPRLLPILADERSSLHQRRAVMGVFAKLKDERTVFPIVRWIIKDTDVVTKTLIEMGAIAELEVMKLLKERDANVRTAAARILQEIGTIRSISLLKRASLDQRDAGSAAAARVALDIVNDRAKSAKAAATTAPSD